jgi:hypothetical protein
VSGIHVHVPESASHLDCASLLEQVGQLALLVLQVRVSANVLLRDENVGDSRLACHFAKRGLDS